MGEKQDRRVRKTKAQLRAGLTKLMKTKSIRQISVKELVDEVDINRSTFYLHYTDIYDMLSKIEKELLDEFISVTEKYEASNFTIEEGSYLKEVFKIIRENSDIVYVLMGPNGDIGFVNKIKKILSDKFTGNLMNIINSKDAIVDVELAFSFYITGCVGIIEKWLQSGAKESPEHMAELTSYLIINGLNSKR